MSGLARRLRDHLEIYGAYQIIGCVDIEEQAVLVIVLNDFVSPDLPDSHSPRIRERIPNLQLPVFETVAQ
jgi:hypothetical protein